MLASVREDVSLITRLLRVARLYWPHLAFLLLLNLVSAFVALLNPIPLKLVVDNVLGSQPLPWIVTTVLPHPLVQTVSRVLLLAIALLIAVALITQTINAIHSYVYSYSADRVALLFKSQMLAQAQRVSLTYHDSRGMADAVFRIQWDGNAIQYVLLDTVLPLVRSVTTLGSMLYVTVRLDLQLAVIALVITPVLLLVGKLRREELRPLDRDARAAESSAMSVVQEALGALRVIKAFGQERRERDRFVARSEDAVRMHMHRRALEIRFGFVVSLMIVVGTGLVMWFGARHVQAGTLTLGELLLVMSYLDRFYGPMIDIGSRAAGLQAALASAERAFALIDEAPDVAERSDARPIARAQGDIEFRDVSFSYDGKRPVLSNVSFRVEAGRRVGVAGRTGSGKTTMMHLMMRFYDPSSGTVMLDGTDVAAYRVADLRNQFACVLQEPVLFSTTIAENIAYGRPGASEEDVIRASQMANADEFITRLPDGYRTLVGERGMQLSAGERQRVSLARAFLKDAPILILDEPTSSVDVRTEASIMEAMQRLMRGRTTFIVAHRLVTLEGCDVCLYLDGGRLDQTRTHPTSVSQV